MSIDARVRDEGSIFLLTPCSHAGWEWAAEHLPADAQRFGKAYVIEHRYIYAVVLGMLIDGLEVTMAGMVEVTDD